MRALAEPAKRLEEAVSRFSQTRILVVGDLILDKFIRGRVKRISPEAPVPIVEVLAETTHLGGAANVINNIRSLSGNVAVCGIVGKDAAGEALQKELRKIGAETSGLIRDGRRSTSIKTRIIAHHQQVVRFDRESNIGADRHVTDRICEYIIDNHSRYSVIVISDYGKGTITERFFQNLSGFFKKREKTIVLDPKTKNFQYYKNISIITPNIQEAQEMSGLELLKDKDFLNAGRKIMRAINSKAVLITRGEQGMTLLWNNKKIDIPTVAKEVFDVTGAGDTVVAVLSMGLALGLDFLDAAKIANHAAGVVVGKLGTATVSPSELRNSLRNKSRL